MYVYDTALRIVAKKATLPERVYLHAGARQAAKALGLDVDGVVRLFRSEHPEALRELEPHQIEDVLCIYKRYFADEVTELEDRTACWTDDEIEEASRTVSARRCC